MLEAVEQSAAFIAFALAASDSDSACRHFQTKVVQMERCCSLVVDDVNPRKQWG
jgi:hypothetical protein